MPDIEKCSVTPISDSLSFDNKSVINASATPPTTLSTALEENTLHQFTEGGLKAYLTVLGAFIVLASIFGQLNAFGTFQAWYASHQLQHLSASTISWIGSLQLWIFFFSGATIGRLFDAYGPTRLMAAGTLCVLFGLGVGLVFYPSLSSVSTHFSKYRATALGFAIAGSSVGGVVYPIIFRALFAKVGFGWGVRIPGLVSGLLCVMATLMVSSLCGQKKPGPYFDIKVIADTRFALLAIGSTLVTLGLYVPYFYIVEYAKSLSISDHTAFYVLAVLNSGAVLGRIAPAYLSDKIGRFNILTPSAFFTGVLCLVFWLFARSLVSLMLFSTLYGFLSGSFVSVINPCVAQIRDTTKIGTRLGMLYSILSFPSLVSGPTAGALLARYHGSFTGMIFFSGSIMIFGSFFLLASKLVEDTIFSIV